MPRMTTTTLSALFLIIFSIIIGFCPLQVFCDTKCWKRKYYVTILGGAGRANGINATVSCPEYYSWTISDYCCYDGYDRFDTRPFCCYSETYKLAVAVGLICLVLFGISCSFFLCWLYNIPHYALKLITCGKFSLNDYMKKTMLNGPYVDPSFYTGEPFWSSGNTQIQPYPLRPMPPGIFYPTGSVMKSRWSNQHLLSTGQMPLFIVASRQFTRNPYSARPNDRQSSVCSVSSFTGNGGGVVGGHDSRRSSTTSNYKTDQRIVPSLNFKVNIDEVEAAAELLDALKKLENKDKNFAIPKLVEETQKDLELDEHETFSSIYDKEVPRVRHVSSASIARKNSYYRSGSTGSKKILPAKTRKNILEVNKIENDNMDENDEDLDSEDSDDENEESFVVPIKTTVTNELGQTGPNLDKGESAVYPLESVPDEDKNKKATKTSTKKKITSSIRNSQQSVQEQPNKRNIPGLISE